MNDSFIIFLTDIFFQRQKDNQDEYLIIKFSVPCKVLSNLYEKLILVDVIPIDSIPVIEKQRYWDIAKKYYTDKNQAIEASKATYILTLITSN